MGKVYNVGFFLQLNQNLWYSRFDRPIIMDTDRQAYELNLELDFVQVK